MGILIRQPPSNRESWCVELIYDQGINLGRACNRVTSNLIRLNREGSPLVVRNIYLTMTEPGTTSFFTIAPSGQEQSSLRYTLDEVIVSDPGQINFLTITTGTYGHVRNTVGRLRDSFVLLPEYTSVELQLWAS